jgi:hypothetical protein
MGKQKTPVSGNTVRTWGAEHAPDLVAVPRDGETFARGRISKALVERYEDENPGMVYVAGTKDERTFEVPEVTRDKRGRKRTTKRTLTLSQVRELAGDAMGSRGLPSAAALAAASERLSEQAQARKASANA